MINIEKILPKFANLIGIRNHYDGTEVPNLPTSLTDSETKAYYNDYHTLLRLDLIKAILPPNRTLEEYLTTTRDAAIVSTLDKLVSYRKLNKSGKDLLGNAKVQQGYGWIGDTITNDARFVGLQINPSVNLGVDFRINMVGFQFNSIQTDLNIYLYNSNQLEPIQIKKITTVEATGWNWIDFDLSIDTSKGGTWYLGYYQDDIVGLAINNRDYNWSSKPCGTCDGGIRERAWTNLNQYVSINPIYVPNTNLDVNRKMFDMNNVIYDNVNYGLNMNLSAICDMSDFFINNRYSLKNALGYEFALRVLQDMKNTFQNNIITNNIRLLVMRDLEGDITSNYPSISDSIVKEIKSINIDYDGIGSVCLPCVDKVDYSGVV